MQPPHDGRQADARAIGARWGASFDRDPFPGRPRVLFVGLAESSHTHGWIDLLADARLNVRLFALPSGLPPAGWPVRTYVSSGTGVPLDPGIRDRLYSRHRALRLPVKAYVRLARPTPTLEERYLARVVRRWRPDVVHTLGVEPAARFYAAVRRRLGPRDAPRWVIQTRGGSDLELARFDPAAATELAGLLSSCDRMLSDNPHNFEIAASLGVPAERYAGFRPLPGGGGVDVDALSAGSAGPPSRRPRVIVWPKAYECPWSKALPVFEALALSWERIRPCTVEMFAMNDEARAWFGALPESIKAACRTDVRVPRDEVLARMQTARVMLAPSLVDGRPNSLYEAMAAGAFPVVSPLPTVTSFVADERNVLFARNLYPEEIAGALVRAMNDDALVDAAAARNVAAVREEADRREVARRVLELYEGLARESREARGGAPAVASAAGAGAGRPAAGARA